MSKTWLSAHDYYTNLGWKNKDKSRGLEYQASSVFSEKGG